MALVDAEYAERYSHSTVSRWESGRNSPNRQRLEVFGNALDLSETEVAGLVSLAGLTAGPETALVQDSLTTPLRKYLLRSCCRNRRDGLNPWKLEEFLQPHAPRSASGFSGACRRVCWSSAWGMSFGQLDGMAPGCRCYTSAWLRAW